MTSQIANPLPQQYLTTETGIGGQIKVRPEDFLVDELPLYEPQGSGEHLYLGVEKTNVAHGELLATLRRHFDVHESKIGFAGMKDKVGVTRQTISIQTLKDFTDDLQHQRIKVLWASRHRNKIRLGHLAGNRFSIRIRQVDPTKAPQALKILRKLERCGVPNYFGSQRFGYRRNNHEIGAAFLNGDWDRMLKLLLGAQGGNFPLYQQPRRELFDQGQFAEAAEQWTAADRSERIAITRLARGKSKKESCLAVGETALAFWVSALQSAMFNRVLDRRLLDGKLAELIEGDVAYKHATRGMFLITPEELATGELPPRVESLEISPSGPLWGREMMQPTGRVLEIEKEALDAMAISPQIMFESRRSPQGSRRPLRIVMTNESLEAGVDEHGSFIRVAFDLPRGAYATVVLREIMKNDLEDEDQGEVH